jgi:CheY-like chemotaxis protein
VQQDTGMPRRILVVDDDEKLLLAVQEWLEGYDYQVKTVATGLDALRLMRSETFDVLITDIVMPDISGLGLIEISQREFPGLMTIAITGYAEKIKDLTLERSPDYFLEKPFKSHELLEALESVLAKG